MPDTIFLGKDLVGLEHLSADSIRAVLDTAEPFKEISERAIKKVPVLRGKTIVNLFFEPSTRTRISFELAEQRLSADIINFTAEASSLKKGESLRDTARNLEALNADFIVIRHSASGAPHFLARAGLTVRQARHLQVRVTRGRSEGRRTRRRRSRGP